MPLVRVFCARAQDCKIKLQSCSLFFFRDSNTSWCAFRNPSGPGSPSNSGGSCEMFACEELFSEDWMDAGTPASACDLKTNDTWYAHTPVAFGEGLCQYLPWMPWGQSFTELCPCLVWFKEPIRTPCNIQSPGIIHRDIIEISYSIGSSTGKRNTTWSGIVLESTCRSHLYHFCLRCHESRANVEPDMLNAGCWRECWRTIFGTTSFVAHL